MTVARSERCAVVVDADAAPDVIPAVGRLLAWRRCAPRAAAAPPSLRVVSAAAGVMTWFDSQVRVVAISAAR